MSNLIKPCPFCGGTGVEINISKSYFIKCNNCGVGTAIFSNPDGAIAAWNRRNDHPDTPLSLKDLKSMDGEIVLVFPQGQTSEPEFGVVSVKDGWVAVSNTECWEFDGYGKWYVAYRCRPTDIKKNEWISVNERLPEEWTRVLAAFDDNCVRIGSVNRGEFVKHTNTKKQIVSATHWMPMPELPGEGM